MSSAFEGLPKTPNLKLNKPGYDNVADIEALNENADILDEEIQGIKNTFVKSVNGINAGDGGNVDLGIMPISQGGTGASTAEQARTNLGIKDIATYDVLPIANGGTGANKASDACKNLGILDLVYPVGSLYWSKKPTNPATLFGGTWTQIKDKFILAAGDSYAQGATGGAATVVLTTDQMPSHTHGASTDKAGGHNHTRGSMEITGGVAWSNSPEVQGAFHQGSYSTSYGYANPHGDWRGIAFNASRSWTGSTSSNGNHSHTVTVNNSGNGKSHENMPPYVTYYCWERTA